MAERLAIESGEVLTPPGYREKLLTAMTADASKQELLNHIIDLEKKILL
jgi:hypothetical protein